MRPVFAIALFGFVAFSTAASAATDEVTIPSSELLSLQTFAAINPSCREWTDGCTICQRDKTDEGHCSTPGIACQAGEIVCKRPAPAPPPPPPVTAQ